MSDNKITYEGTIVFELSNITAKHEKQAEWKRTAMILLEGDVCELYMWFLNKRFGLQLQKPLRKAHVSFINDNYLRDSTLPEDIKEIRWEEIKNKYNNTKINVTLSLDYYTNDIHWWLIVPHDKREELHDIRAELGLSKPYFGLHMSIGYVVDYTEMNNKEENIKNKIIVDNTKYLHSAYIHRLNNLGLIELH